MSTTTDYPTITVDGQSLRLVSPALAALSSTSELRFYGPPDPVEQQVVNLTGLSATQIDETLRNLPENFHEDGQKAAVPGRARNLVKSAIEDGWIVTIEVAYRRVTVEFLQPASTIGAVLYDTLAAAESWDSTRSRFMALGYVRYGFDHTAQAMRIDEVTDQRLVISPVFSPNSDDPYRNVSLVDHRSNLIESDTKFAWRDFVEQVHTNVPALVAEALKEAQAERVAQAAAVEAFAIAADTPSRNQLRRSLVALRDDAHGRISEAEARPAPSLHNFDAGDSYGADVMRERAARCSADQALVEAISDVFNMEGVEPRVHIEEALVHVLQGLVTGLLDLAATCEAACHPVASQKIYSAGHAIEALSPLAKLDISAAVVA